jgi:hypothetical protein
MHNTTFRELLYLTSKNGLSEALKIIKKNWKFIDNSGQNYKIEINDDENHPILDRIKDRTNNSLSLNEFNVKLQKGIDLILNKAKNGFFKKDISYIELTYTQSLFKVIIMIKPNSKYLRISSIFEMSFKTANALHWDIKEFFTEHPELEAHKRLEEFYTLSNDYFAVEINERTDSSDVYLSDTNDIIKLELKE